MQLVHVSRRRSQRCLDLLDRVGVEQLAQLLDAHELAQEVAVERQRLRAPLLGRSVVLVHVCRDVLEEERRRERRGRRGLDLDEVDRACLDPAQEAAQRRQVEHVLQALAVRLEHDRELRVAAGDLEQALGLQPLLPERRALTRPPSRDEKGAGGVLAEPRSVQRRLRELGEQQVLDLLGVENEIGERRRGVRIREVQCDPVVRPQRLHVDVQGLAQPRSQRHRPRSVHAAAEGREDADPPVPDLVAEALDDDRPVGGHDTGDRLLLAEERQQVARGERVEPVLALESRSIAASSASADSSRAVLPIFSPELRRPPDPLALPERRHARHARRRRDEHAVARDLLDPPGRRAEQERLALAGLVDHLLVELADPPAAVGEEDAEEPTVGDRPGVRDGEPPGARAPADGPGGAVPHDPRTELRELVGRIAAREHVEDVLELRARELGERIRAARELVQLVDRRPPRRRTWRRSAARGRRAGSAGCASPRSRPRASRARRPPTRGGRARNFGKIRPFETECSSWPARPTRCRPRATDFGLSTWMTRSTAPMSMPSSSEEVATRHGISPAFRSSSTTSRCSRASEPWCARASSSSASSLIRSASRSASRRLLTKTMVERCARTSSRIAG